MKKDEQRKQLRDAFAAQLKQAGTTMKAASVTTLEEALKKVKAEFPKVKATEFALCFEGEYKHIGKVNDERAAVDAAVKMSRKQYEDKGFGKTLDYQTAREKALSEANAPAETTKKPKEVKPKEEKVVSAPAAENMTPEEDMLIALSVELRKIKTADKFNEVRTNLLGKKFKLAHYKHGDVEFTSMKPSRMNPDVLALHYRYCDGTGTGGVQVDKFVTYFSVVKA